MVLFFIIGVEKERCTLGGLKGKTQREPKIGGLNQRENQNFGVEIQKETNILPKFEGRNAKRKSKILEARKIKEG